jgi:hypothetical protein
MTFQEAAEAATAVGSVGAAIVVVAEYLRQQRLKKSDRASELEAALQTDPLLSLAATILDWGAGTLPLPEDLRAYTSENGLTQDLPLLFKALRPKLLAEVEASRTGTLYRITFVALFNYLQRAAQLWQRNYIVTADIALTRDLAKQLINWEYAQLGGQPAAAWFLPAMKAWYPNVHGEASLDVLVAQLAGLPAPCADSNASAVAPT